MIEDSFPILTEVCGPRWLQGNHSWIESLIQSDIAWFYQLESDLKGLERYFGLDELIRCYRKSFGNRHQIKEAIYEIHGCHLMAEVAGGDIRLHVPLENGRSRNFDFQANILGDCISGDVKTRKDKFPFNLPTQDENGDEMFAGTRTTLDPHDASRLNIPAEPKLRDGTYVATPESTVIKQLLEKTLEQLPLSGKSLVVLGHIGGIAEDGYILEGALYGTEVFQIGKNIHTHEIKCWPTRLPTGIFSALPEYEHFNRLSAVLMVKLSGLLDGQMGRHYHLYLNGAAIEPISDSACDAIVKTFCRWVNSPENNGNS